jgi:hypothetical protein
VKIPSKASTIGIVALLALIALKLYTSKDRSQTRAILDAWLCGHHSEIVEAIQRWRRAIRPSVRRQHRHAAFLDQHPMRRNSARRARSSPQRLSKRPIAELTSCPLCPVVC